MDLTRLGNDRRPNIDLETVHETLALIRDDLAGTPEFEAIEQALTRAMGEIEAVTPRRPSKVLRLQEQLAARFVPWSPGR